MATRGYLWHRDETGIRYCRRCDSWKSVEEFNWLDKAEGLRQYVCKSCQRKQMRERYTKNKERVKVINKVAALNGRETAREYCYDYLLTHPCMDCGEKDPTVLSFDHVRGEKDTDISNMVNRGYSVDRIKSEIKKCDVVCLNCHILREAERRKTYRWIRGS